MVVQSLWTSRWVPTTERPFLPGCRGVGTVGLDEPGAMSRQRTSLPTVSFEQRSVPGSGEVDELGQR